MTHARFLPSFFVVAAVTSIAVPALAQEPVQWRVEDGGNGHWYDRSEMGLRWPEAEELARARGGLLASMTSAQEVQFIRSVYSSVTMWIGARRHPDNFNVFMWIDGSPWNYQYWRPMEPSGCNPCGSALYVMQDATSGWDDTGYVVNGDPANPGLPALIEWSADCNNDGIVDLGQIRDGTFADTNDNGVPDCCEPGTCVPCAADIVRDLQVDGVDLAAVLGQWGTSGSPVFSADLNGSGLVDGADLAAVLSAWGPCPD